MKIEKIELQINHFKETVNFYKETLDFTSLDDNADMAVFKIGESQLVLHKNENDSHYYHFAFNIPSNMFYAAKAWLASRVPLLTEDHQDEVHFNQRTQAYACYFEDPAGKIVEFIARTETSPASSDRDFSANNVLSISEINLSTDQILQYVQKMKEFGIPVRDEEIPTLSSINFMGEYEDGAFILLGPLDRRWIFSQKTSISSPTLIHTDRGLVTNT
ncbi:VOC family protein [Terribacillus saccharophilus]|uniref:VOC family protein n=1 Tax=Terribacillus saccharophilus TaxID=361277 RepID=UPI00159514F1|nr:VOC family protein [Terribacillus saccharophilus]